MSIEDMSKGPSNMVHQIKLGQGYFQFLEPTTYGERPEMAKFDGVYGYSASYGRDSELSHGGLCWRGEYPQGEGIRDLQEAEDWAVSQWARGYVGTIKR